ncbi:MAG: glutathione S-transferase family protein [Pseudomonadota bacterium]
MLKPKLVIGNKNYSTWSLRPWLLLAYFDVDFDEENVSLNAAGLARRLGQYSPTCRVPVLIDGETTVWDSLAICEFANEKYLDGRGWPQSLTRRAYARALSAEMHAGFTALRSALPMNLRARRRVALTDEVRRDITRIDAIWRDCEGPWLCGEFSIADCMYAPVAMRFPTYNIELSPGAETYANQLRNLGAMQRWVEAALKETEIIAEDEAGEEARDT